MKKLFNAAALFFLFFLHLGSHAQDTVTFDPHGLFVKMNLLPTVLGSASAFMIEKKISSRNSLALSFHSQNSRSSLVNQMDLINRDVFGYEKLQLEVQYWNGNRRSGGTYATVFGGFRRIYIKEHSGECRNCEYHDVLLRSYDTDESLSQQIGFGLGLVQQVFLTKTVVIDFYAIPVFYTDLDSDDSNFHLRLGLNLGFGMPSSRTLNSWEHTKSTRQASLEFDLGALLLQNRFTCVFELPISNGISLTAESSYQKWQLAFPILIREYSSFSSDATHYTTGLKLTSRFYLKNKQGEGLFIAPYTRYRYGYGDIISPIYEPGTKFGASHLSLGVDVGVKFGIPKSPFYVNAILGLGSRFWHNMPSSLRDNVTQSNETSLGLRIGYYFGKQSGNSHEE